MSCPLRLRLQQIRHALYFRYAVIVAPPINYDDAWLLFNAASG